MGWRRVLLLHVANGPYPNKFHFAQRGVMARRRLGPRVRPANRRREDTVVSAHSDVLHKGEEQQGTVVRYTQRSQSASIEPRD